MPWPKGKPRGSKPPGAGRKKGTPNKRTVEIEELFRRHHFNPIERMIELCNKPRVPLEIKAQFLKELAQYGWPKRKAVEHSGMVSVDAGIIDLSDPLSAEDLALAHSRNGSAQH